MESIESHHRRLYKTVAEAEGGGTKRAGWIGVDLGTVTSIVAFLLEIQLEQPHHFCAWNHGNYHALKNMLVMYKDLKNLDRKPITVRPFVHRKATATSCYLRRSLEPAAAVDKRPVSPD